MAVGLGMLQGPIGAKRICRSVGPHAVRSTRSCGARWPSSESALSPHGSRQGSCRGMRQVRITVCGTAESEINATATEAPAELLRSTGPRDWLGSLRGLDLRRLSIWAFVACLAYNLRAFFGIAMGTFILSFIGNSFVNAGAHSQMLMRLSTQMRRRILVLVYFAAIIAVLVLFGALTITDLVREGADFIRRLQNDSIWAVIVEKMRLGLGDGVMDSLDRFVQVAGASDLRLVEATPGAGWNPERTAQLGATLQSMLSGYTNKAVKLTSGLLSFVTRFALQMVISMVLGFVMLWDLPAIAAGVQSLRASRLSAVYDELVPPCSVFGTLFGKALQVQAKIALVNTLLTGMGMWLLRIPGIGLLSLFVFLCSFIPVAGCIISTVPIGFVALTEYGFNRLFFVIVMVTGVHMVEAYGLNPALYSAHLKLHPLLVLSVLVIAEHSLGIWGLLLAVPLTVFALDYCIRYPSCSVTDVARQELDAVMSSAEGLDIDV